MPAKRGGSSTQGKSGPAAAKQATENKSVSSAMDAQNVTELIDYMQQEYGFKIQEKGLKDVDFEAAKEQVSALEEIFQEFPGARDAFKEFEFSDHLSSGKKAYAEADKWAGIITLNKSKFKKKAKLDSDYSEDVRKLYHVEGTTSKNIASHEAGHILERAMAMKYLPQKSDALARIDALSNRTFATLVVERAFKSIEKSTGKTLRQLRYQVSEYAHTNMSETLAECTADYMANRSKARPLSKAVYKVLKQELG